MELLKEDISRIKKIMGLIVESEDSVTCDECEWSWKLSEGGDDPYTCHKCGHTNKVKEGEIDEQEEGGEAPSGPSMTTWETGLTRGKANPIDDTTKWESGLTRGKGNPVW